MRFKTIVMPKAAVVLAAVSMLHCFGSHGDSSDGASDRDPADEASSQDNANSGAAGDPGQESSPLPSDLEPRQDGGVVRQMDSGTDVVFGNIIDAAPTCQLGTSTACSCANGTPGQANCLSDGTYGTCRCVGGEDTTYSAVFQIFIVAGCNGSPFCHAGPSGGLVMNEQQATYDALVGVAAMGMTPNRTSTDCRDSGLVRVVPGDPANSLLMQMLEGTQTCGTQMPPNGMLTAGQIEQVRVWIANGAVND